MNSIYDFGFSRPPQRVVSLVPSVTETLFELGCGPALVAATDFCVHPADRLAGLPRVGGTKDPDLEKISAARPDLIIANQEENRRADVEALQAAGYPVWVTFPRTVAEAIAMLWDVVNVFRTPEFGPSLTVLEKSVEWASLAAENAAPVRVFCPIWREPAGDGRPGWWMTFNRDTYAHDLLRVCGALNVFADRERRYPLAADLGHAPAEPPGPERDTRYPRVTPEEMAALAPDLILLPSEPFPFGEADRTAFSHLAEVPAVRHGRIELVDGSLLTWPGIRLAKALMDLPALIQPIPEVPAPPGEE